MKFIAPGSDRRKQLTLCGDYRCAALAIDVFNLSKSLSDNEKFARESQYTGYNTKVQELKNYMAGFNVFTWNTNIYWSSLDILNVSLADDKSRYPVFMRSEKWFDEKELNNALGSWVNIHLAKDIVSITSSSQNDFTALRPVCNLPNYIEPSLNYLYENISRNNMLLEMMDVLNVSRDTNLAALDIEDANDTFERVIDINKKTLNGNLLNYSDCMYIRSLVNNKKITPAARKSFNIHLSNKVIQESIGNMKMMIVVFGSGDDKIIAMGPVYNYKERIH
jgi:hypothetical protein